MLCFDTQGASSQLSELSKTLPYYAEKIPLLFYGGSATNSEMNRDRIRARGDNRRRVLQCDAANANDGFACNIFARDGLLQVPRLGQGILLAGSLKIPDRYAR
jgi:hypothetical protein